MLRARKSYKFNPESSRVARNSVWLSAGQMLTYTTNQTFKRSSREIAMPIDCMTKKENPPEPGTAITCSSAGCLTGIDQTLFSGNTSKSMMTTTTVFLVVFLYFISILVIAFNLIVTAAYVSAKMSDRPIYTEQYVGGSGDISQGQHVFLNDIYRISSFLSYVSIWTTTFVLMNSYREKLANPIIYWIILCIPHVYFLMTYFYQIILSNLLISYLEVDPITVSIVLGAFLSLSKPIGGVFFGVAFWKISRTISYEKNIKIYMIISGWGIFLIFSANQAEAQIVSPYPPFGIATITILNIAAFLMLVRIYNSAVLVSASNDLRKSIYQHALESKLLGVIGSAEMEKELQKTVTKITNEKKNFMTDTQQPVELDGMEKKYIDFVVREVKKDKTIDNA